jgi:putative oxidoreductase
MLAGAETGPWADAALAARIVAGSVFVGFGIGKFVDHAGEVGSFESYGLPSPDAFVYAIGLVEIGGGLLLLAGLATRAAALVLAGNMIGAITVSGIGEGEIISLTLAPLLLALMVMLVGVGPGHHALDRRLATRGRRTRGRVPDVRSAGDPPVSHRDP